MTTEAVATRPSTNAAQITAVVLYEGGWRVKTFREKCVRCCSPSPRTRRGLGPRVLLHWREAADALEMHTGREGGGLGRCILSGRSSTFACGGRPVSASRTAATIFVACTSRPTRLLAFAMAGSSNMRLWAAAWLPPRSKTTPPPPVGGPAGFLLHQPDDPQSILSKADVPSPWLPWPRARSSADPARCGCC